MKTLCLVVMLVAWPGLALAQRDTTLRATPIGTSLLRGRAITTDEPARPLRRVLVTLSGAEIRGDRQTMTDDDGRFVFAQLPAGRYTVAGRRAAYLTTHYGSPRPGYGPGSPIALSDGQTVQIELRVPRGAVLAGVIRDSFGRPMASGQAQLSQVIAVNGVWRTTPTPDSRMIAATDDKGRYRFYGLPAGDYVVRGTGSSSFNGDLRLTTDADLQAAARDIALAGRGGPPRTGQTQSEPPSGRVTVAGAYAPSVTDLPAAQRFRLVAGQEVLDADITVQLVRTGVVSGMSVGPSGAPLETVMIAVVNTRSRTTWTSPGGVRPDAEGRFTLTGMPPGEYALVGRGTDGPSVTTSPMTLYAETSFAVNPAGDDVTGVVLQFDRGITLGGRVEVIGAPAPPPTTRVGLVAVDANTGGARPPSPVEVQVDGSYALDGVAPGKYRIVVTGAGSLSLRAAMLNDIDTLDGTFEVRPREDIKDMRIVLTSQPTEVTGTLFDSLGRPVPEYAVVLFSTNRAHWITAPRRQTGLIKLDSRGAYRAIGLPPGSYYLAAVTDVLPAQLGDPAFLEQLAAASLTITIVDGEKKVQDLRMR